jgi:hypothetical protein
MTEIKKVTKKASSKPIKHVAKKTLFLEKGKIKKGEEFTCTDAELKALKANGGV